MTLLVFGAAGQIGSALCARNTGDIIGVDIKDCDICDEAAVGDLVARLKPSVVINCAAYTAVDRAESDHATAFAVNEAGAGNIARAADRQNAPVLHISTDYVYAGMQQGPQQEDAPIAPANIYGASKAAGDNAVIAANGAHIILRVSWVFSATGNNFVKTMLKLGRDRPELRVIDDQIGGPTEACDIADVLTALAGHCRQPDFNGWGIYNFAGAPAATWCQFAAAIFAASKGPTPKLTPIPSSEYLSPACRPYNSQLDCGKIQNVFGIKQPDWRLALERVVGVLEDGR